MKKFSLVILPIILLVITLAFKTQSGPYWLGTNSDPDYVYLLNSLNLARGLTPGYYFHPGTPLQIIGVPVIVLTHFFHPGNDLITDVLTSPELFLNVFNYYLLFIFALTVYFCGLFTYRLTGNLISGLLLQFTPFLTSVPLLVMHRISPEPLLLIVGFWFSYLVLNYYYSRNKTDIKYVYLFALISGFSIALKFDSLPVLVIPFIIFPGIRKIQYLLITALVFLLFTLPVISHYHRMFGWFADLLIHSGTYGVGETWLVNLPVFMTNMAIIFITQPLIILITVCLLYFSVKFRKLQSNIYKYKYILGLGIYFVIQIMVISKHFNFRYLVPPSTLTGLALIIISRYQKFNQMIYILLIVLGLINISFNCLPLLHINPGWQEASAIRKIIMDNYPESFVVAYYGNSSVTFSLKLANDNAGRVYTDYLSRLYPGVYFYNLGFNTVSDWRKVVSLPAQKTILFQGVPFISEYARFLPAWKLTDLYHGTTETLYKYR